MRAPYTRSPSRVLDLSIDALAGREARRQHRAGAVISDVGGSGAHVLVARGWAACVVFLQSGRRQLVRLLIPGDLVSDGQMRDATFSVMALTACESVSLPLVRPEAVGDEAERLRAAVDGATVQERLELIAQVVRLGRMSAVERTSHLLLELWERLHRRGLTTGYGFDFPLTQEMLADTLGLSVIHVNRTLQLLRRNSLINLSQSQVILTNPDRLAALCSFDLESAMPGAARRRSRADAGPR